MRFPLRLIFALLVGVTPLALAGDLPFDRDRINRYSLDHLPRSLSFRWSETVWLGYDLERAKVYKVWQAREGQPGLRASGFTTRSSGTTLFEDTTEATWRLRRDGNEIPLTVRYLGCSDRKDHFELRWELRHEAGVVTLHERLAKQSPPGEPLARELRAEGLEQHEALIPPSLLAEKWEIDSGVAGLGENQWQRFRLK